MASRLPTHPPEEFQRILVQEGRVACERHFKASRRQVDAWLRQIGKANLIEARSGGVASQRETGALITRQTCMVATRKRRFRGFVTIDDKRQVPNHVLMAAVRFLQIVRNGGWIVTRSQFGDWRVGMMQMSSYQLVDFAVRKGFKPNLQPPRAGEVNR